MTNDLTKGQAGVDEGGVVPAFSTPSNLIAQAIARGLGPDSIAMLIQFRDRMEAERREAAFNLAWAEFRAKVTTVPQKRQMEMRGRRIPYESLADVCEMIDPIMGPLGLSYSWKENIVGRRLKAQCILRHADGHIVEGSSWEQDIPSLPTRGEPNEFHNAGAALSYVRRLTLKGSCGLAATDSEDDNAATLGQPVAKISENEAAQLFTLATSLQDRLAIDKLLQRCGVTGLREIPAADFQRALQWLAAKKQAEAAAESQGLSSPHAPSDAEGPDEGSTP